MSCTCVHICRLSIERGKDGPFPECKPADHHFSISRTLFVKGSDGEVDKDFDFLPEHYATLDDALRVVGGLSSCRWVVDETPRATMFPAWSGWPDEAMAELARREQRTAA